MRPPPPSGHPQGSPEELAAEQPDIPELVLNDLIEEYARDKPRRDAEAKTLWPRRKEKRK